MAKGNDVVESRELGPDPGDPALLEIAASEQRILVTIDTDFGKLVFVCGSSTRGASTPPGRADRATHRLNGRVA